MSLFFSGLKNLDFRKYVEDLPRTPIDMRVEPFAAYRKTALTYAAKVQVAFEVATLEGIEQGKAGDYLAVGIHGEMYPIDADVFAATYEAVNGTSANMPLDSNLLASVD